MKNRNIMNFIQYAYEDGRQHTIQLPNQDIYIAFNIKSLPIMFSGNCIWNINACWY